MGPAHGHGVGQLGFQFVRVDLHALGAASVDHVHKGPPDQHGVRPQGQGLKDVQSGADAAVHQHGHFAAHGVRDGGEHLGGGGALIQHPATVVADHDAGCPGLQGLLRAPDGHDALEDEGRAFQHVHDLPELRHGLAARGGLEVFQEGQARRVDVHGDGEGLGGLHQGQLLPDGLQVPGLDGRHAPAVLLLQSSGGGFHDGGVGSVSGEGGDARLRTGGHQDVIVGQVVVLVSVVELHRPHGGGEDGEVHLLPEEGEGGVHGFVLTDGIHVDAELLPFLVVADEARADALGPGAGDAVPAAQAVAGGAGLAVGAHTGAGGFQDFLIGHVDFLRAM